MKPFILFSSLLIGISAWGAGYQLRYQGAEAMGTAFASAGSYGNSLSQVYFNPGWFIEQDKDHAVALELMAIYPTQAEFTQTGGTYTTDDFTDTSISGAFFYGLKVGDDAAFTMAFTTPWGTSSEYESTWPGALRALKTDLKSMNLQMVLSKKVTDSVTLSIGPQIQQLDGELTSAGGGFSGDGLSVGGIFALTYTPTENTALAFNYTSQIKHILRGDFNALLPAPAQTSAELEITTPDVFTLSLSQKISDALAGHFSASYTNWSLMKSLDLMASTPLGPMPISSTPQKWDDTYMLALGATYNMSENFTLRGGVSYETGAVDNQYRTPRSFDTDRIGIGLGTSFDVAGVKIDMGLNHILYTGDIEINQSLAPLPGTLQGAYNAQATLLRVGAQYNF